MTDENTPKNDSSDQTDTSQTAVEVTADAPKADRIAKVMARAGVASRREAERMIIEGRVSVNGNKISSPALDIFPHDQVRVDGKLLDEPQETRVWLYYKPTGLVTSASDEKGRQTVFDALPRDLPRVMTVGRLDLNSEGLLLLTNDGELKRRLELPTTGWLRRYRVRVNGRPTDLTFDPLRRGVVIEGEEFAPMEVRLDSQQGANAWLSVGIREGRNREIRRAMAHIGLIVNRLIRIGYGPFKLTGMEVNEVREVKRKMLRDQLGGLLTGEPDERPREFRERGAGQRDSGERRPFARREDGDRKPFQRRDGDDRKPFVKREDGERRPFARREDGDRKPFPRRDGDDRKPFVKREDGERKPFARREDGDRKPFPRRDGDDRKPFVKREDGERRPYARREDGDRKPFPRRDGDDRKPFVKREDGERRPYARREDGDRKPFPRRDGDDRKPFVKREDGERKPFARREGDAEKSYGKPAQARLDGDRAKPRWKTGGKPSGAKGDSGGHKPYGGGRSGSKPGQTSHQRPRPQGSGPRKPRN